MTIREMISKYRTNCIIEIRRNNFEVIEFRSEDYEMVKDELLDNEVDNWFVYSSRNRVVIDFRTEQE